MEYQQNTHQNPFRLHSPQAFLPLGIGLSSIPVENRLRQNKQRRMVIEKEKQREKQQILQKRKLKEDNVQKILRQKHEARQNAKLVFGNMQKTYTDKFSDQYWRKAEDIEQKILQCRTRADQYRTMYMKKLQEDREDRKKNVRARKDMKDKEEKDRSINYHLAEWRSYQKKIAEKYRGESQNPNRMYEKVVQRQEELKQLIDKHRYQIESERPNASASKCAFKKINIKQVNQAEELPSEYKSNPIYSIHEISSFGLSKSIKNPDKMMQSMRQFIENSTVKLDPIKDEKLMEKFRHFLEGVQDK